MTMTNHIYYLKDMLKRDTYAYFKIFFPLENQHWMKSEKHRHEKKNLQPFVVIYVL